MYSCIFSCKTRSESVCERNSTTKSGQSGGKLLRSSSVSAFQRASFTQARSGERFAPFGSEKTVEESKLTPVPSRFAQLPNSTIKLKLRFPVSPPVGGIIIKSPSLVRSIRQSGFAWQNAKK